MRDEISLFKTCFTLISQPRRFLFLIHYLNIAHNAFPLMTTRTTMMMMVVVVAVGT